MTAHGLCAALQAIVDRHDALRLRAERNGLGEWTVRFPPSDSRSADSWFTRLDLAGIDDPTRREKILAAAHAAEGRLDPRAGVMLHAVWFTDDGANDLLVLFHGLVVDEVSTRILRADLKSALSQIAQGRVPVLDSCETPFRAWAKHLVERTQSPELIAELPTWNAIRAAGVPFVANAVANPMQDTLASTGRLRVVLSASTTSALLSAVPAAFHARTDDVLLTALALTVADWRRRRDSTDRDPIVVDVEAQRPESITSGIDLSHTVGRFTWLYPACLDVGEIEIEEALSGGRCPGLRTQAHQGTVAGDPRPGPRF